MCAAVDIMPFDPPDDVLPSLSSSPSASTAGDAPDASSARPTPPFEEALGPTDLVSAPVPNEGDVQLLHAVNAAIYQSIYSGTEEARRNRWRRIWQRYYKAPNSDADVALESLPPAHLCPPPDSPPRCYPNRAEAIGAFEENILQQQNFVYIAEFSLPPFLFLSRKAPQGFIEIQDLDHTPSERSRGYGLLTDVMHLGVIPALKKQYSLTKLKASWLYRPPSCDVRLAADGYGNNADELGNAHVVRTQVSLYDVSIDDVWEARSAQRTKPKTRKYDWRMEFASRINWNTNVRAVEGASSKTTTAGETFARIQEYSTFPLLLAATRDGRIDGLLLPAATASVLLLKFGNIFGRYGVSLFTKPQVVGYIGENNIPLVYTLRKYPMEPPYITTFFDETYDRSKIICQEIIR